MIECLQAIFLIVIFFFFFSSRRRHTRFDCDWSSDVCSSDLLQNLFENPKPIAAQNLFYVSVVESALDQFAREIMRVRMARQVGNKMRRCEFCGELFLPRLRPLPVDELEEVKRSEEHTSELQS